MNRYKISDILRDSREHQQNTLRNGKILEHKTLEMERIKKSQALNIPKHSLEVRLKRRLSKNYSQVRKTSNSETPNPMKAFRSLNTQRFDTQESANKLLLSLNVESPGMMGGEK